MTFPQWPRLRMRPTPALSSVSAIEKNTAMTMTKITTMMAVMMVSRRVGQVTLFVSLRTCCRNCNGFVFAIVLPPHRPEYTYPGAHFEIPPRKCKAGQYKTEGAAKPHPPAIIDSAKKADRLIRVKLAGAVGIEPTTYGFGDRRSTS